MSYPKKPNFHHIQVKSEAGIRNSGLIESDRINVTDTLYVKNLVVTEDLRVPVKNDTQSEKETVIINDKSSTVNKRTGKINYDSQIREIKITGDDNIANPISRMNNSFTKENKIKQYLLYEGWSAQGQDKTTLKNSDESGIFLDDHIYYQASGYLVGLTNTTSDPNNYNPIAYMSRIDYFIVTLDSFSDIGNKPINHLSVSLFDNVNGEVSIVASVRNGNYYLDIIVSTDTETKWYGILSFKKYYIQSDTDRSSLLKLKFSDSDTFLNWTPVYKNVTLEGTEYENIFKYFEKINIQNINPFAQKITDPSFTYLNSVINDETKIQIKFIKEFSKTSNGNTSKFYKEIINDNGTEYQLSNSSTLKEYNIFSYYNILFMQPNYENTKKYASSYGYDLYMNNYNNSGKYDTVSFDNMFGNTFTKEQTKNVFNYHTTTVCEDPNNNYYYNGDNLIPNKQVQHIFQSKEKEQNYLAYLGISYNELFCVKELDDKSDSNAHKDQLYYLENIVNISDDFNSNLVLYKFIGDCVKDTPFNIYMDDNGSNTNRFLSLGKHHYIKVYSVVRNISTKKFAFFTHSASIIIPSFSQLRERFVKYQEGGETNLNNIKINFDTIFVNSNTVCNYTENDDYDYGVLPENYNNDAPFEYVDDGNFKYIKDGDTNKKEVLNFEMNISTETILNTIDDDNSTTNNLDSTLNAYNTFDIKFPIKVSCTTKHSDKFQIYMLLEINKFSFQNY
tara:strand:- start:6882 stop:9074 length:2193 start_codon:yes stop_codon:yes gene_type:complete